jgi:ribosomal protein S18 acetylase RimI-like enzyme
LYSAIAASLLFRASRYIETTPQSRAQLSAALSWARDCGIISIYLEARKSNEAAIALYKKHGFDQVGQRKNYYADPAEDAILMAVRSEAIAL